MSQLSALIGKSVLNISTSCIIGKVTDVYFDEYLKTAAYFCIDTQSAKYLLEFAEAQSILDAVVIADDVKFISPLDVDISTLHGELMDMPVYTPSGADKGKITDIFIFSNGKVSKLQTATNEFTPASVLSIGNVIIQKGASKSRARKVSIPRPDQDYPVYVLNDTKKVLEIEKSILAGNPQIPSVPATLTVPTEQTPSLPAEKSVPSKETASPKAASPSVTKIHTLSKKEPVLSNGAFEMLLDGSSAYSYDEDARTPTRVICDYEFLLGRTLGADLTTYTGELIARKNSVVTDTVVNKARKAGKLVELTLNSVKPQNQN
ncbi:MAG: hypothetical protein NC037_02760 [Bacteroides sp.]|nr:hypothetical protein [Bacillota bacterium]MCM1393340.1 hypothetical protein [[Eubacterium] siraeum]MCM1455434.1 hypothetical protein [Bacteroides sp.]